MPEIYSTVGEVIAHAAVNVSCEIEIILTGAPCKLCEQRSVLAFKAEKGQTVRSSCSLP